MTDKKVYVEVAARLNEGARLLLESQGDAPNTRALLFASRIQLIASESLLEGMKAEA